MDEEPSISVEEMTRQVATILRKHKYMASDLSFPYTKAKDLRYNEGNIGVYIHGGQSEALHVADFYIRPNGEVHLELYKDNKDTYVMKNEQKMIDQIRDGTSAVRSQIYNLSNSKNYEVSKVKDVRSNITRYQRPKLIRKH